MTISQREPDTQLQWVHAEEEILADLRPDQPFDARASFQAFGERQFGGMFAGVAFCCELPSQGRPRWEAALELREELKSETPKIPIEQLAIAFSGPENGSESLLLELTM
jgi:hypothetical protein